jgi:hypothetical protein
VTTNNKETLPKGLDNIYSEHGTFPKKTAALKPVDFFCAKSQDMRCRTTVMKMYTGQRSGRTETPIWKPTRKSRYIVCSGIAGQHEKRNTTNAA